MKYTTSLTSTFHLTSLNFSTKELILYQLQTTSTSLLSRRQYLQKLTTPSPKLSTKEPETKPQTNLSKRKLQTLTIDTILTPKRIQWNYFKKNKQNLVLIYILSVMFTTPLLTPNNSYNLLTFKPFQSTTPEHHSITHIPHPQPQHTQWQWHNPYKERQKCGMGTTWFTNKYTRQLVDLTTYKCIDNFDQTKTITDSKFT